MSARNSNQSTNAAKPAKPVAGFSWGLQTTGLAGGVIIGATYSTAVTELYA